VPRGDAASNELLGSLVGAQPAYRDVILPHMSGQRFSVFARPVRA
jgi:hypothetical protein